jgi:hypothetical protein
MNYLASAQVGAMVMSIFVCIVLAKWYFAPWSNRVTRRDALLALLWLHVPRYVTLILLSAQHDGYPISNRAALEAIVGDVAGASIALTAIVSLHGFPPRLRQVGVWLSWLLVFETTVDIIVGIVRKAHEPLWGKAGGVTWLILDFFIPALIVSIPLLVWQLLARHRESLSGSVVATRVPDFRKPLPSA